MDAYANAENFEAKERLGRFQREAEQWRLSRLATSQRNELQGRRYAAPTAVWNSLVSWAEQIAGSRKPGSSDAPSSWTETGEPQEQCC
jgi:hypothetical protein